MGLYTRADHDREIKELNARQVKINRLLVSCVWCGTEFESLPGVIEMESQATTSYKKGVWRLTPNPILTEAIFKHKAQIVCGGCGRPRQTAIDADTHRTISRQIDEAIKFCDGKLVGTALRIQETRTMEKGGLFAWVIGAKKNHEQGCAKKRQEEYCTCKGLWFQTRGAGVLIKFRARTYRDSNILEVEALEKRGVTCLEVVPRRNEREEPIHEDELEDDQLVWVKVPIELYDAYQREGRWRRESQKYVSDKELLRLDAAGLVSLIAWEARWMVRLLGTRKDSTHFEAAEVWSEEVKLNGQDAQRQGAVDEGSRGGQ